MSIWNKILVGLIIVCSLVFFYMAAWTLKVHQKWRESAANHQRKIEQLQEENLKLAEGVEKTGEAVQPGIRQLRLELNKVLVDRGRAWFKCAAQVKPDPANATAEITITAAESDFTGLVKDTILEGFDDADVKDKGRYLGEFKIVKADPKQLVLTPSSRLSPREMERLATVKGSWNLYSTMPRDNRHDRPLRDYQVLLGADRLHAAVLAEKIDAAAGDKKLVDEALALASEQEQAAKNELAATKQDVKDNQAQRDAAANYRNLLERELETVKTAVAGLIETNQAMAGQIAKLQLEAARRIDQRTRAVAQSGAGGT